MKVLVICSQYPPMASPEGKHALMLCEHLGRHGADVHLLTSTLSGVFPAPQGFSLHPEMTSWSWSAAAPLLRAAKRIQPDVIVLMYVSWIYCDHPMITFAPTLLRWAGVRAAFVTLVENTVGGPTPQTFGQKLRWRAAAILAGGKNLKPKFGALLEKSDALICLTQHHLDELAAANPTVRAKATIIPAPTLLRARDEAGGATRAEGRGWLGLKADDDATLVLIFFGYIYPGKGIETLLQAIALLQQRGRRNLKLVIAGKVGPELKAPLEKLEAELGVADRVVWLGHTEDDAVSTYLRASDVAVLPFDQGIRLNNSSFAVCAMHGLPVITTRGENMEPLFQSLKNALLCPPQNAAALADAIEQLAVAPELRRELARGSLAMAEAHFSWDATIRPMLAFLASAVQRRRGSAPAK